MAITLNQAGMDTTNMLADTFTEPTAGESSVHLAAEILNVIAGWVSIGGGFFQGDAFWVKQLSHPSAASPLLGRQRALRHG